MAFVDTDVFGDDFINVSQRTGATGHWDDLLAVQAMLQLVFTHMPPFRKLFKGTVSVTGKPAPDTPILIALFQKNQKKKPVGYVDPAIGGKFAYTIVILNHRANFVLAAIGEVYPLLAFMHSRFPLLAPSLKPFRERPIVTK